MADHRQITVYLPQYDPLRVKLIQTATAQGVSLSALIRQLLERALANVE